ncbi:MAG: STAS domain-containing protein [Potamolinea sp.]
MAIAILDSKMTILQPSGHINASNAAEFKRQLAATVASEPNCVLVDMQRVESLDSAGLMSLVSALSMAQNLNRRFSICSVPPSIQIIFELTQLDRVFDIFESREAFKASVNQSKKAVKLIA